MKGVTGSAGAVAVIAFGLYPGAASTTSLRHQPAAHGPTGGAKVTGSPSMKGMDGSGSSRLDTHRRRLQASNDDARDVNGTVSDVHLASAAICSWKHTSIWSVGVWWLNTAEIIHARGI